MCCRYFALFIALSFIFMPCAQLKGAQQEGDPTYNQKEANKLAQLLKTFIPVTGVIDDNLLPYCSPDFAPKGRRLPVPFLAHVKCIPPDWGTVYDIRREPSTGAIKVLTVRPYKNRWHQLNNGIKHILSIGDIVPVATGITAGCAVSVASSIVMNRFEGKTHSLTDLLSDQHVYVIEVTAKEITENISFEEIQLKMIEQMRTQGLQASSYDFRELSAFEEVKRFMAGMGYLGAVGLIFYASFATGDFAYNTLHQWLDKRHMRWNEVLVFDVESRDIEASVVVPVPEYAPHYCFYDNTCSININGKKFTKNVARRTFIPTHELLRVNRVSETVTLSYNSMEESLMKRGIMLPLCFNKGNTYARQRLDDDSMMILRREHQKNVQYFVIDYEKDPLSLPLSTQGKLREIIEKQVYHRNKDLLPADSSLNTVQRAVWHQRMFEKLRTLCDVRERRSRMVQEREDHIARVKKRQLWGMGIASATILGIMGYLRYAKGSPLPH